MPNLNEQGGQGVIINQAFAVLDDSDFIDPRPDLILAPEAEAEPEAEAPALLPAPNVLIHRFTPIIARPILQLVANADAEHIGQNTANGLGLLTFAEFKEAFLPPSDTDAAKDRFSTPVKWVARILAGGSFALEVLYAYYTYVYGVKGINNLATAVGTTMNHPDVLLPQGIVKTVVAVGSADDLLFNLTLFDIDEEAEVWAKKLADGVLPSLKKFLQSQMSVDGILNITVPIVGGMMIQFPVGAWFDVLSLQDALQKGGDVTKWIANALVVLLGSSYYTMAFYDAVLKGMGWYTGMKSSQLNPEEASLIGMFRSGHKASALNVALLQYIQLTMRSVSFAWGGGQMVPQFGLPDSFVKPVTAVTFVSSMLLWGAARNRRSYTYQMGDKGKRGSLATHEERAARYEQLKANRTTSGAVKAEAGMFFDLISMTTMVLFAWASTYISRQAHTEDPTYNNTAKVMLNTVLPMVVCALAALTAHFTINRPNLLERKLNELILNENDWTDLYVLTTRHSNVHKFTGETFKKLTASKGTYIILEENRDDRAPGKNLFYFDRESELLTHIPSSQEALDLLSKALRVPALGAEYPEYHFERLSQDDLDILATCTGMTREQLRVEVNREYPKKRRLDAERTDDALVLESQPVQVAAVETVPEANKKVEKVAYWGARVITIVSQATRAILNIVPSMDLLPSRFTNWDKITFAATAGSYSFENGRVNFVPMVENSLKIWGGRFVNAGMFFRNRFGNGNEARVAPLQDSLDVNADAPTESTALLDKSAK